LTNAIFLLGAFMVIHLDAHPEQAFRYTYIYIKKERGIFFLEIDTESVGVALFSF